MAEPVKAVAGKIWQAAKVFPGFNPGYLKTLSQIGQLPHDILKVLLEILITGDTREIEDQIDLMVNPVAQTFEQARDLKSMLMVLFNDERTMTLLGDFAQSSGMPPTARNAPRWGPPRHAASAYARKQTCAEHREHAYGSDDTAADNLEIDALYSLVAGLVHMLERIVQRHG